MTQRATPQTVVGNFEGQELTTLGQTLRLQRRGDEFWVELPDPEWTGPKNATPQVERKVVLTTGSHHQQFYWHETSRGNALGLVGFVYRIAEQCWLPYHEVVISPPPSHGASLIQPPGAWNSGCIQCHATFGRPRIPQQGPVETQVAELGIACESCHGPAEQHVDLNHRPDRRYLSHLAEAADSSVLNPADLSPKLASHVCGQCHGVWLKFKPGADAAERAREFNQSGYSYRPGDDLHDSRSLLQPTEYGSSDILRMVLRDKPDYFVNKWWPDGVMRVAGREYNSMIESPCFDQGEHPGELSCLSCHSLHPQPDDPRGLDAWADDQLRAGMRGNEACLQCHDSIRLNLEEHTHHGASSSGSLCYNCHMPFTSYGLLKAIRSHTIESPSVQTTVATGRPNACNQCHLNRTLAWTGHHLQEWYGLDSPALDSIRSSVPASLLWLLRGDAGQRALMAWSFGWDPAREISGTDWMARFLALLLEDPYHAVRWLAYRSLRSLQGFEDFEFDSRGDARQRALSHRAARERWQRLRRSNGLPDHAFDLIDDTENKLRPEIYEVLLRQRNDRPVLLLE
jgi:hypothetical protein